MGADGCRPIPNVMALTLWNVDGSAQLGSMSIITHEIAGCHAAVIRARRHALTLWYGTRTDAALDGSAAGAEGSNLFVLIYLEKKLPLHYKKITSRHHTFPMIRIFLDRSI